MTEGGVRWTMETHKVVTRQDASAACQAYDTQSETLSWQNTRRPLPCKSVQREGTAWLGHSPEAFRGVARRIRAYQPRRIAYHRTNPMTAPTAHIDTTVVVKYGYAMNSSPAINCG